MMQSDLEDLKGQRGSWIRIPEQNTRYVAYVN